ncbi:hypothetical protein N7495_007478 [Penicillium taxi]|uniref:uncharacterized protein n=1 Tax=Penicillium taxi TaxID=168475 RepID=UPI0025458C84|nr:uncharacterized protein N7495_007478 [Penicillium taxi]KAJ5887437.1 hypothetical protein N7495_007478 [Penicillium taxi]
MEFLGEGIHGLMTGIRFPKKRKIAVSDVVQKTRKLVVEESAESIASPILDRSCELFDKRVTSHSELKDPEGRKIVFISSASTVVLE